MNATVSAATINVSTSQQLIDALKEASPGDEIVLASGSYTTSATSYYYPLASFYSGINSDISSRSAYFRGTQSNITLRSANAANPAVLEGAGWNVSGYVLHVTGSNWVIKDLVIRNGAKGLILDNSSNTLVQNVEIYDIGQEGLHIRDHSHDCVIDNINLHDVGKRDDGFGEGIYIGSDNAVWWEGDGSSTGEKGKRYRRACHNTLVKNSTFGPNITAEPVEIKEGSENTIIENCIIRGSGISGSNFADSHLDIKGTYSKIRNNTFYQDGNSKIARSIMVVPRQGAGVPQEFTAHDNYIYGNTFDLNSSGVEVAVANSGSEDNYAWNNTRIPSTGNFYNNRINDFEPSELKTGIGSKGSSCHVATPELGYEVAGGSGSFSFEIITEETFTVSTDQSWMSASRNGNTITVTYNSNTTGANRSGRVNIDACLDTYVIIEQTTDAAPSCTLDVASTSVSLTNEAGSITVAVTSDETFTVSDNQSWITATKSGENVVINTTANSSETVRTGSVSVIGCEEKTITVVQSGTSPTCKLNVSNTSLSFTESASSNTITVTTTDNFTVNASQSWVTTSISGASVTINVAANTATSARNATVSISGCENETITITQSGSTPTGGGTPMTINVSVDSYAREDKPNNKYGTSTSIRVISESSENQVGYLKFDLSSVTSSDVNVAMLRLYPYTGEGVSNSLHVANTNSWSESDLNWNSKPSYGSAIATWFIDNDDQYFYIDITNQVRSNAGGDLTLVITGAAQEEIRYRSRESGSDLPLLQINNSSNSRTQNTNSLMGEKVTSTSTFMIFPNPNSTSTLNVSGTDHEVQIFNLQGELLLRSSSASIDISSLVPGFYIVKSNNQVKKMIKE
ncbi:BACON domain-containing protein [Flammeovirga sp. OC4]|uniref:CBM96 family carbohydrate-binding protein n=1 Tax=Flammeovirga sp. OC4 TaxID=1382345 RepID=UPI000AA07DD9|nr:BACON domain-containing carbohydrate-binding protein [Flammeovirga sp. OC4]